ncbi:hypothetical protein R1flu_018175 [Riccia fluitans]|uniref:Uncharacterized protein n=1 Tax=Riccia fluitans TaxID=41844 RepID=A0ABD1ZG44_9MARC
MADEAAGERLPTIWLVDEELYNVNTTEQIRRFCSRIQFVPYSFKDLKDLDHVKFLAMYCLNMLKLERDRSRFWSKAHQEEGFLIHQAGRSNKFLTPMILAYLRGLHDHSYNWAKAILHGLRTEILFMQSKASSNEDGKTIPVVWAPCFVHILFGLRCTLFVGTPLEEAKGWVGWTHVTKDTDMSLAQLHSKFPKLITSLDDLRQRCKLPEEIPIASLEQPVSTRRPHAEDKQPEEIPIASLEQPISSKRPHAEDKEHGLPSTKKNKLPSTKRQSTKELTAHLRRDIAQVINSHLLLYVQARIQRHSAATDTWKKAYEDQLSKVRELQETNDGLREKLVAKDAKKSDVHALARTEVQRELEELKRSVTKLEVFKRSVTAKEKAAEETYLQKLALVQTELEEYKRSSEASIKRLEEEASRLREALAAKESAVQALENAHQKEISTLKATCQKYKTSLDGEIWTNADLHARVLNLQDELNACYPTPEDLISSSTPELGTIITDSLWS